jgi:hypothetical protein
MVLSALPADPPTPIDFLYGAIATASRGNDVAKAKDAMARVRATVIEIPAQR